MHDAVRVGSDGRDDRDAPGLDEVVHRCGIHRRHVPHQTDVGGDTVDGHGASSRREQVRVLAGDADSVGAVRVDQSDQLATDLPEQDHAHDVHHFGRRHAEAAAELPHQSESSEHGGDLRTAAVHDHRVDTDGAQERHVGRERGLESIVDHGVAAVLDHDDLARPLLEPREGAGEDACGVVCGHGLGRRHDEYAEFSST